MISIKFKIETENYNSQTSWSLKHKTDTCTGNFNLWPLQSLFTEMNFVKEMSLI